MNKKYITACVAGIAALNLESAVRANIIFNNTRETGNQYNYTLGMDFTVNSTVSVTALGTFDSNIAGISGPVSSTQIADSLLQAVSSGVIPVITVGIFDVHTGLEVSPTATFNYADALSGAYYAVAGSIFLNITPFSLPPGTYSMVATGYNYLLFNGIVPGITTPNFDTLGGALTLLPNGARASAPQQNSFELPTYYTGANEPGGNPVFAAGTAIMNSDIPNVPDAGSTMALLGLSFGGLTVLRRSLKK